MKLKTLTDKFNRWIRERDKNPDGTWTCVSCGKKVTKINAGHFYPAKYFSHIRFDPDNVNGQCIYCNIADGSWWNYQIKLKEKIGEKRFNELTERAFNKPENFKWTEEKKQEVMAFIKKSKLLKKE